MSESPRETRLGPAGSEVNEPISLPIDPWRLVVMVRRHCIWLACLALVVGVGLYKLVPARTTYVASAHLGRLEPSGLGIGERGGGAARGTMFPATLTLSFARSSELARRVSSKYEPLLTLQEIASGVEVLPVENPEVISLRITGRESQVDTAALANAVLAEIALFTRDLQIQEAREAGKQLAETLAVVDRELAEVNQELAAFHQQEGVFDFEKQGDALLTQRGQLESDYQTARIDAESTGSQIRSLEQEILKLRQGEIDSLLVRYTEEHPLVQERLASLEILKSKLAGSGTNVLSETDVGGTVANNLFSQIVSLRLKQVASVRQIEEWASLRDKINVQLAQRAEKERGHRLLMGRLTSLETNRTQLAIRQRETQLPVEHATGHFRPLARVEADDVSVVTGQNKRRFMAAAGAGLVLAAGVVLLMLIEVRDDRLKTSGDLRRVTGLPVLATLGELKGKGSGDQTAWALRAWTMLHGHVNRTAAGSVLCGFIASRPGEGCTTWIHHLAGAARRKGYGVVILSTRPEPGSDGSAAPSVEGAASTSSGAGWLKEVARSLDQGGMETVVLRPPAGWRWNRPEVEAWKAALGEAMRRERAAILVELPPAEAAEAMLVADTVPQAVWLARSGVARMSESRSQLETLVCGGCKFVGAVLNSEPNGLLKRGPLSRLGVWAALLGLGLSTGSIPGEERNPASANLPEAPGITNQSLSVHHPSQRAVWQERLTLGPGDVLNVRLFGSPELGTREVVVGPDGRLSYLQAQDVTARGLTIDELRQRLEAELGRFYRRPRIVLTPVSFHSKKYFILGAVAERGVFTLDRPMTIIEAVARAKGLGGSAAASRRGVEDADFSRSFMVRGRQQVAIDLERLFGEGDLTQNIALEPNDFIYFAPAVRNEVYVLGAVLSPGVVEYNPRTSLLGCITARGGFSPGAWRNKVLVVRGSLTRPETFVLNTSDMLKGKATDFQLERKDIVYVSKNPWYAVGQVVQMAVSAYMSGLVVTWTGETVTPAIDTKPYLPPP